MTRIRINHVRVKNISRREFVRLNEQALPDMFERQIKAEKWKWNNNVTVRKNGDIVGTPRDIVDTGDLLNSYKLRRDGMKYEHSWGVPYAALVYLGSPRYPARPWAKEVLENLAEADSFGDMKRL